METANVNTSMAISDNYPMLMGFLLMVIGCIGVILSIAQILFSDWSSPNWFWGSAISRLIFSLAALTTGMALLPDYNDPAPAPPPETPAPEISTPPAPEPETYTLPVVENLATLWLIPLALVTLLIGGVLIWLLTQLVQKYKRRSREHAHLRERLNNAYATYRDQHDKLNELYTTVHTDWHVWLHYPAITDLTVPETAAMNQAWHRAHQLRETDAHPEPDRDCETLQAQVDSLTTQAYPVAVDAYQRAFDTAMATAKRIGTKTIPRNERVVIRRITALLRQAENRGATAAERQSSYAKATELLAGLRHVTVPKRAVVELKQRSALMLET